MGQNIVLQEQASRRWRKFLFYLRQINPGIMRQVAVAALFENTKKPGSFALPGLSLQSRSLLEKRALPSLA